MDKQPIAHVTFEPNNGLKCMQDFQCFTNAPAGVRFAVYPVAGMDEKYKLVGPGYGEIPGNYGNGAIYVFGLVRPNNGVQPTAEAPRLGGLAADMNPERQPAAADA